MCVASGCGGGGSASTPPWPTFGHDLNNSRFQSQERAISRSTAPLLKVKWSISAEGPVTATPAIDSTSIYFPDGAGFLYRVDRSTGQIVWKNLISQYTNIPVDNARGTPALVNGVLILGNQAGRLPSPQPARVFAVNAATGLLVWSTQVDSTSTSYVTHSPIVYNGTAFVGVASNEELLSGFLPASQGWQWSFRGSVVALDVVTGAIKWQSYTVPSGYFGGSVWGSAGAVDTVHNTLYMATGNNYSVPVSAQNCLDSGGSPSSCLAQDDYFDSILALDMNSGIIKWAGRGLSYDAYNVGCGLNMPGVIQIPPNDNCPNPHGPDWDFAQGPMIFNAVEGRSVGAGQKSGVFWAFDINSGFQQWSTQVAPGGSEGGMQWGSATDGTNIYVAVSNSGQDGGVTTPIPPGAWKQKDGTSVFSGGWAALDAKTGSVVWTTPDPAGSFAQGPVSLANGVVFGCDLSGNGAMVALDATTGAILWSYDSGAPCLAGASIADGVVYWGSGRGSNKVFAFSVNGH